MKSLNNIPQKEQEHYLKKFDSLIAEAKELVDKPSPNRLPPLKGASLPK